MQPSKVSTKLINQGQSSQFFGKIGFILNEFIENCKNKKQIIQGVDSSFREVNWESSGNTKTAYRKW